MKGERALAAAGVALFAIAAAVGAAPSCGSSGTLQGNPSAASDASRGDAHDGTTEAFDTAFDTRSTPPDAGQLPVIACGPDAGADGSIECPLPSSYCVDRRWLASYVNGTCVDGTCRWWRVLQDCHSEGKDICITDHCGFIVGK